jgi:ribonuclease HI
MTNICTINTDASFHPTHKVGGFAFWIVYQGIRTIQSGPLKSVNNSHDAEVQAIANGLYAVLKSKHDKVERIIINTDCKHAIYCIQDKDKKFYNGADEAIKMCHLLIEKLRKRYRPVQVKGKRMRFIEMRYVKAHSEGETARLWVNNYLDREAKRAMREQLKKEPSN